MNVPGAPPCTQQLGLCSSGQAGAATTIGRDTLHAASVSYTWTCAQARTAAQTSVACYPSRVLAGRLGACLTLIPARRRRSHPRDPLQDLPPGGLPAGGGTLCFDSPDSCLAANNACSNTYPCRFDNYECPTARAWDSRLLRNHQRKVASFRRRRWSLTGVGARCVCPLAAAGHVRGRAPAAHHHLRP